MSDDSRFIEEVKTIANTWQAEGLGVKRYESPIGLEDADILRSDNDRTLVEAKNTVIELGHPTIASLCLSMITERDDLVTDNGVTVVGRELHELSPGRYPFVLIVLCAVKQADKHAKRSLSRNLSACGRLVGVTARVALGRIWVRIAQDALDHEVTLGAIGWSIVAALQKESPTFSKAEVMFVIAEEHCISRLRPVADSFAEQKRVQYKAELEQKMECDSGLTCDECPETDTCRILKDAAAIVKKKGVMWRK